jgi:hypothetical protein
MDETTEGEPRLTILATGDGEFYVGNDDEGDGAWVHTPPDDLSTYSFAPTDPIALATTLRGAASEITDLGAGYVRGNGSGPATAIDSAHAASERRPGASKSTRRWERLWLAPAAVAGAPAAEPARLGDLFRHESLRYCSADHSLRAFGGKVHLLIGVAAGAHLTF